MEFTRMAACLIAATLMSGCATLEMSEELERLQEQMTVMDGRVTHLEQSVAGAHIQSGASALTEPAPIIEGVQPKPAKSGASSTSSNWSKPSTRQIQKALRNGGFYQGAIDGKMGPLTKSAIREFQQASNLQVDGVVGLETWNALRFYVDVSAESGGLESVESLK